MTPGEPLLQYLPERTTKFKIYTNNFYILVINISITFHIYKRDIHERGEPERNSKDYYSDSDIPGG